MRAATCNILTLAMYGMLGFYVVNQYIMILLSVRVCVTDVGMAVTNAKSCCRYGHSALQAM